MVTAENEEVFWVLNLVREEQANSLERLLTPIHIVAQEEVICFWWESAVFK
jgi:hypothetical protein